MSTNTAPVFTNLNGNNGTYIEGGVPVIIDPDVSISDAELNAIGNYAGARLTLSCTAFVPAENLYSGAGIVAGQASGDVIVSSTTIGTYAYANGILTISFNSNATQSLVNDAMRSLAYSSTSDFPNYVEQLSITWRFYDGNTGAQGDGGELSRTGTAIVDLSIVNDAPTIAVNTGASVAEGETVTITGSMLMEGDPDHSGINIHYGITGNPEHGTLWKDADLDGILDAGEELTSGTFSQLDITQGKIKYTHDGSETTLDGFDFTLSDTGYYFFDSLHVDGSFDITINPVNDAPSFSSAGVWEGNSSGYQYAFGNDVLVLPDGTILLAGDAYSAAPGYDSFDILISAFNSNGSSALNFGTDGHLAIDFGAGSGISGGLLVRQNDGKILVAGSLISSDATQQDLALVRINPDGSLDSEFGTDGKVAVTFDVNAYGANGMTVLADGKILLMGTVYDPVAEELGALVRLNSDGSVDESFGVDGLQMLDLAPAGVGWPSGFVLLPDGKIMLVGTANDDIAFMRLNSDGSVDTDFGTDGLLTSDLGSIEEIYSVTIVSDGILVAGTHDGVSSKEAFLAKYDFDGNLDTDFGMSGYATLDLDVGLDEYVWDICVQPDGKILLAGSGLEMFVARFNSDGSLDVTFGINGVTTTEIGETSEAMSLALDGEGRILVAARSYDADGTSSMRLVRYLPDGTLDTSSTLDNAPTYVEGGAAVILDGDAAIFDSELDSADNYDGASLTLVRHGGSSIDDVFSGAGIVAGQASGTVVVGTTTIGSYAFVAGELVIEFNANATQALVHQAMQQLAYANLSSTPDASVQIDWLFNDGNASAQGSGGSQEVVGATVVSITAISGGYYNGTPGADFLVGSSQGDVLSGQAGSDIYVIDHADDVVIELVAEGVDRVNSFLAAYTLPEYVENGRVMLSGDAVLVGNSLNNVLFSGAGSNTLDGGTGVDTVSYKFAAGGVTIDLGDASPQTTLGSGVDQLIAIENLTGSLFDDYLTGDTGNNVLNGLAGADTMTGGAGNDIYLVDDVGDIVLEGASEGRDQVRSYLSDYTLPDNIEVGRILAVDASNLTGNALDNILVAALGDNVLDGGLGIDTAAYNHAISGVTINLSLGGAQVTGGSGTDTLVSIENLRGSAFNDQLTGDAGRNVLNGAEGDDILSGGAGNDILAGGAGSDQLSGGDGRDTFVFNAPLTSGADSVLDFSILSDTIKLDSKVFTALSSTGTLNADNFVSGAAVVALDANDFILYDENDGKLYYDADGSGAGSAVLIATLWDAGMTHPLISNANLLIY